MLIAFSPILLGVAVWLIACIFNKEARHWGYLLKISKDATTSTKNFETINEEEPSVAKFIRWMKDLDDSILKKNKIENKSKGTMVIYSYFLLSQRIF